MEESQNSATRLQSTAVIRSYEESLHKNAQNRYLLVHEFPKIPVSGHFTDLQWCNGVCYCGLQLGPAPQLCAHKETLGTPGHTSSDYEHTMTIILNIALAATAEFLIATKAVYTSSLKGKR